MVDPGTGAPIQVVCGAPNARTGMKGVFAPAGTHIPGTGIDLKAGNIRGEASNGMLLSERELGLSDDARGDRRSSRRRAGRHAYAAWAGLDDPVIDIAVTPNRPDALGVYGIARDLAAKGIGRLKPLDHGADARQLQEPDRGRAALRRSGEQALPALRRALFPRREERPVARLDAAAASRHRPSPDLRAGRHHQLHHHELSPARCTSSTPTR